MRNATIKNQQKERVVMQTITSRQGMVTQFDLADGTKVWLNSGSALQFPNSFTGDLREVKLQAEAFFKVTKNKEQPFHVHTKNLDIEVLGTSFNVVSYDDEHQAEVVLVEGKVKLSDEKDQVKKEFGYMLPEQRAVYTEDAQKLEAQAVAVEKYIAWRDGNLVFRDDPMEDVVSSGPVYQSLKMEGGKIRLKFTSVGEGLVVKDNGKLKGFAISGSDHKFYWAEAFVEGNEVVVSSSKVPSPEAVRYSWEINPEGNLYNKEGLPAPPFRTDDWKGITE
jgi:hypothetical protein